MPKYRDYVESPSILMDFWTEADVYSWAIEKVDWGTLPSRFKRDEPNFLIISHAQWGKDTAAAYMRDAYGLTFESSSMACLHLFLFEEIQKKYGLRYDTMEECFADRINHRDKWHDLICAFNTPDKAKLARIIIKERGNRMYVGMRSADEAQACLREGIFDWVIWVDASKRMPPEPDTSFNIDESIAHFDIDNNGTIEEMYAHIDNLMEILGIPKIQE
jgi:hypothetical protein